MSSGKPILVVSRVVRGGVFVRVPAALCRGLLTLLHATWVDGDISEL